MTPARYPLDDKPEFDAAGRLYQYPTGLTSWNRPPPSFTWTCPHCRFGPTDLEGAHDHLAEHYSAQPVAGESSERPSLHQAPSPSSDNHGASPALSKGH